MRIRDSPCAGCWPKLTRGREGGERGGREPSRGYIRTLVNQRRKEMHGEKDEAVSAVVTGRDIHAHVMHTSLPGAAIRLSTRGIRLPRWSHYQRSSSTPAEQTNLAATVTIKIIIGPRDRPSDFACSTSAYYMRILRLVTKKKEKSYRLFDTVDIGKPVYRFRFANYRSWWAGEGVTLRNCAFRDWYPGIWFQCNFNCCLTGMFISSVTKNFRISQIF